MLEIYKKSGRLTKISDNANNLRSNHVIGYFHAPPMIDTNFTIFSKPLDPTMNHRRVSTSLIEQVWKEQGVLYFKTANSVYMLEVFEHDEDLEF